MSCGNGLVERVRGLTVGRRHSRIKQYYTFESNFTADLYSVTAATHMNQPINSSCNAIVIFLRFVPRTPFSSAMIIIIIVIMIIVCIRIRLAMPTPRQSSNRFVSFASLVHGEIVKFEIAIVKWFAIVNANAITVTDVNYYFSSIATTTHRSEQ